MRKLISLIILVGVLSACNVFITPEYRYIPEPSPYVVLADVYYGYISFSDYPTYSRTLVLDFRNSTYQLDGSAPTHMYFSHNSREITLGEPGGYRLYVLNRSRDYIEGTWRFSSRIVEGGRFYAERR